jgi:hypothetical protein
VSARRALALLVPAAILGCDVSGPAPDATLSLLLIADDAILASVDAGRVRLEGPTPRTVTIAPGEERTIDGLLPGTYTVALEGLAANRLAVFGEANVQVVAGESRRVNISLASFVPASISVPGEAREDEPFDVVISPVPGAVEYCFEHAMDPGFAGAATACRPDPAIPFVGAEGTHYFRAFAVNRFATAGVHSPPAETSVVGEEPVLMAIAEARGLPDGRRVAVEAVVTVGSRMHRPQGDQIYVQDHSGGLQVFGPGLVPLSLVVGDAVRIAGRLGSFQGERQI